MDDILKCYQVLDLAPGASAEIIRRAYIELTHVWDPDRYSSNPILRSQAEQKRKEIDDAYVTIRAFLPELRSPQFQIEKEARPERDFGELATGTPVESTRAILGIIVGIAFLFIFAWAFYLFMKGRIVTPPAASLE